MKVLWVNPAFLDYRVPAYAKLNALLNGNLNVIFDKNRVPDRIPTKIRNAIGKNAIVFSGRKLVLGELGGMSNKHLIIPFTPGLMKSIATVKPDLIIAEGFFQWTPKALVYAWIKKIPLVIAYEKTERTERNCPKWRSAYRKIVDKFVAGYLCNGQLTQKYLLSLGVDPSKLYVGGMSADSENLKRKFSCLTQNDKLKFRNELNLPSGGLTYVFVGRLIPLKGVQYLLMAWQKHTTKYHNDQLLIVGGGSLYDEFLIKYGNNPTVHFTNNIDYENVYKYYAVSDVFVIPTLEDNWSLVVPEAMSIGLPVAVSIYNGCYPELCREGENGVLFDPLDDDSILKALDKFHHIDLEEYGRHSVAIEKLYDHNHAAENMYEACTDIYKKFRSK